MSLRLKIALAMASLAAVATLAVGVLSYRSTRDRMYAEVDASLAEAVVGLSGSLGRGEGVDEDHAGSPLPPRLRFYEFQLLDDDGDVSDPSVRGWEPTERELSAIGDPGRQVLDSTTVGDTRYRVLTVGLPDGAVQIARPLGEVDSVLASLRARTAVLVVAVTAAAALLGSMIASRVTSALRRLTATADTVRRTGRTDVDVAVPAEGDDEVTRLGAAFAAMLSSLDRSRAEQQRLVQDAGHELRTPLTSLRTNFDVLRRHPNLEAADRVQIVDDIHAEIEEMVDLVDEVVTVASGVATDEPATTFVLADVVREAATRCQRRTGRVVNVVADDAAVHAQPAAIERAVANLLDNAAKFDESEAPIEVHIAGGSVEVADRGPGIPPDELGLVFERFHRATAAHSQPGSGLGLAIVHDVVERNGGTVWAANRDGGGARVGFGLPLAPE